MTALISPTGKPIVLRPVRRNAGIEAEYRKRLTGLVDEMNASLIYWLGAAYKASGAIAEDESPAMAGKWQSNFDKGAERLGEWFALKTRNYSDVALKQILRDAGFAVEFKMTTSMNNAYQAVIGEQVGLIKSIASQHLTSVETLVMQSVQSGRDLGTLAKAIENQYGVTKRRAALIARDQNNKASVVMTATRQKDLGITEGIWRHSSAGRDPRPSHVKANGERFDLSKGMYLDGEWLLPGQAINCRCSHSPVIPGYND